MVKRFEYLEDLRCIVEDEDGSYVAYAEYKELLNATKGIVDHLDRINGYVSIAVRKAIAKAGNK
jgi:hypothetical protein